MEMPDSSHLVSINRLDFGFAGILHPCIFWSQGWGNRACSACREMDSGVPNSSPVPTGRSSRWSRAFCGAPWLEGESWNRKVRLGVRRSLSPTRTAGHWSRLPHKAVLALSLEILKTKPSAAWSDPRAGLALGQRPPEVPASLNNYPMTLWEIKHQV